MPKSHLYLTVTNIIFYVRSLAYPGKKTLVFGASCLLITAKELGENTGNEMST